MKPNIATLLATVAVISLPEFVCAQHPPSIGYMFPPGGQAGQTVDVILGGYDWTPDMQLFVHDRRIQLEIISPPGPIIVPEPPYWFGKKSRRAPEPLPRETIARLTIASDVPPGIVTWQAANANGATSVGKFVVNHVANVVEVDSPITGLSESGLAVQQIASLPVCISGQIKHIQEVDRYQFTTTKSGPITCQIVARAIDSKLNAVVEIRDHVGKLVAEAADTAGNDIALTFAASANETYTASVYDLDFRGDRSFVYQLTLTPGPRVVTGPLRIIKCDIVGKDHVRVIVSGDDGASFKAMAFRQGESELGQTLLHGAKGRKLWLTGRAKIDDWGSALKAELHIDDAAFAD